VSTEGPERKGCLTRPFIVAVALSAFVIGAGLLGMFAGVSNDGMYARAPEAAAGYAAYNYGRRLPRSAAAAAPAPAPAAAARSAPAAAETYEVEVEERKETAAERRSDSGGMPFRKNQQVRGDGSTGYGRNQLFGDDDFGPEDRAAQKRRAFKPAKRRAFKRVRSRAMRPPAAKPKPFPEKDIKDLITVKNNFADIKAGERKREARKMAARKIVADKTIAGAFMQRGDASKLFATGEDGTKNKAHDSKLGSVVDARFGLDRDRDDEQEDEEDDDEEPEDPAFQRPERFLPRMCYVSNTYLGGNAAYLERLRRLDAAFSPGDRVYRRARASVPDLEPPATAGMALSATLSRRSLSQPGRAFLQIGLRGSTRYGWRRPPLDIAVVIDPSAMRIDRKGVIAAVRHLSRRLGGQDRMLVVGAQTDAPIIVQPAGSARELRFSVQRRLDKWQPAHGPMKLGNAMDKAAFALDELAANAHRVPGSQVTLVLVNGAQSDRWSRARKAAHRLTLQGAVTSVLAFGATRKEDIRRKDVGWWRVANAGHGSFRLAARGKAERAVDAELQSLTRVVARLLRVNIRLGKHAHAVRVIGAKVLGQQQVKRVKAREKVIDKKIAATMGVKADRGDDDDGIQTVIPYFLGGDSHTILVELWLDEPGAVADVTLRYKDLVTLGNATSRVAVSVPRIARPETAVHRRIRASSDDLHAVDIMRQSSTQARAGDIPGAARTLRTAAATARLRRQRDLLNGLASLVGKAPNGHAAADALDVARERQLGEAGHVR